MTLRHTVLIVTHPGGVEFHLDHRVDERRGHHRVVDDAGLVAWIADAGDAHPLFRIAAGCPCQRGYDGRDASAEGGAARADGSAVAERDSSGGERRRALLSPSR